VGVGVVQEEDGDLLVGLPTDIHTTMDAVGWFIPIDLTGTKGEPLRGAAVTVLDREGITTEENRDAVIGVAMPGSALARSQVLAADERRVPFVKNVFSHPCALWLPNTRSDPRSRSLQSIHLPGLIHRVFNDAGACLGERQRSAGPA
jgi:hypothetical protein